MEGKHTAVAPFAEQGPAQGAELRRRGDPAGGFGVEFPEGLQVEILRFRQQAQMGGLRLPDRTPLWGILFSPSQGLLIVAEASAACGALLRAIPDLKSAVAENHVRLTAAFLHPFQGLSLLRILRQRRLYGLPFDARMPLRVGKKSLFQGIHFHALLSMVFEFIIPSLCGPVKDNL